MSGFITLSMEIRDEDDDDLLGKKDIRLVRINTAQISSFRPSKDEKGTEVFLSGGEMYHIGVDIDNFEDSVAEVENFFDFQINAN